MRSRREFGPPALRPEGSVLCIVMVCTDSSEADEVGRLIAQSNSGCFITYRRAEDLVLHPPAARAALVILATREAPEATARALRWLGNRWPHCPVTVVGDAGSGQYELAARAGGATYVVRPVTAEDWSAVLAQATARALPGTSYVPRTPATGDAQTSR